MNEIFNFCAFLKAQFCRKKKNNFKNQIFEQKIYYVSDFELKVSKMCNVSKQKFQNVSDFKLKISQPVRFQINFSNTRQILN